VAFDLPEHRFTAQQAALYVKPNDELEFARGLVELMDDAERRQAMGSFGRQRVESALAWSYSVPPLLDVYRTVTAAPAPAVTDANLTTSHACGQPEMAAQERTRAPRSLDLAS
jgi:hypothetical protein